MSMFYGIYSIVYNVVQNILLHSRYHCWRRADITTNHGRRSLDMASRTNDCRSLDMETITHDQVSVGSHGFQTKAMDIYRAQAMITLQWCHNGRHSISNHQPLHCLLNSLFRRRSKKTSKLCVTGLCAGNSPVTVNSPHKWPVTRKMFPFDDVIMSIW